MTPQELALLDKYLQPTSQRWLPLAGPQQVGYTTPADITLFGGAAGGGKTDLAIGLALTAHQKSIIMRREGTQLRGIIDRLEEVIGSRDGFNENTKVWRLGPGRFVELGAAQRIGDEKKYQGRPHDLIVLDEITHFAESQLRFLMGWNRTDDANQRCRVLCTGNPPTDSDGEWVIDFWGPWLDPDHPNPAKPGELRWFVTVKQDGKEVDLEVGGPEPVTIEGETLDPLSRTFIPSRVQDNPFLMAAGYERQLQNLPVELRERMLKGIFVRSTQDNPWQIIPSAWVDAAVERWRNQPRPSVPMNACGVDVARGGADDTVIVKRYGDWVDFPVTHPGIETPDGPTAAAAVVAAIGNEQPAIGVDVIGIGSSAYDSLAGGGIDVVALNGSERTDEKDRHQRLGFVNKRALWWWRLREALDPENGATLALPPDPLLKRDLVAVRWKLTARGVQVESKEEIYKRIHRSPDRADALAYANAVDGEGAGPRIRSL